MFADYTLRPDTTQAIKVTTDNYLQVADWITGNLATDRGTTVIDPGTTGMGRPRISFTAKDAPKHTGHTIVPIPGYLTRTPWGDGTASYTGHSGDLFDDMWQRIDPA